MTRAPAPESARERTHRRIVVGVDGSAESHAALEWAVREAQHTGDEVDAVLAYDSGLAWIDVGSEYQKRDREALGRACPDPVGPDARDGETGRSVAVAVHPLAVAGFPAEVLVEIAREADLLVVGSRGRGAFTGLLLGSTSQRCAERSSCPVVDVPAPRSHREDGGGS